MDIPRTMVCDHSSTADMEEETEDTEEPETFR